MVSGRFTLASALSLPSSTFLCSFGLDTCPTPLSSPSCLCSCNASILPLFLIGAPLIPYRHPSLFSISLSRIGGLSSGSIKTSWLTDSHGKWCLGKKGFRGSSWGLPISTMDWSTADPTDFWGTTTHSPGNRPQVLSWPSCLRDAPVMPALPGPFLALGVELGSTSSAHASSFCSLTLCTVLPKCPHVWCPSSTSTDPYALIRTGSGQSLDQPAGRGHHWSLVGGLTEVKAAFPLWDRWEGQARKGPQALANCLSCLSLSMGCPQRKKAKVCPLRPAWGFQQLDMSSLGPTPQATVSPEGPAG